MNGNDLCELILIVQWIVGDPSTLICAVPQFRTAEQSNIFGCCIPTIRGRPAGGLTPPNWESNNNLEYNLILDENAKLFTTNISDNTTPTNDKITTPTRNSKTLSRKSTLTNIMSRKINDGRSIRTDVVIRNQRPMDILSFYSHDILFINDDDVYNPNNIK